MTKQNQNGKGFTLIELLIVIAIIGILSAIGYPVYTDHIKKGKRVIAQGELMALSSAMNQFFVQNSSSYVGAGSAGSPPAIYSGNVEIEGKIVYKLTIDSISASAFTLKATPQTGTSQADDGYLTLNHEGVTVWNRNGIVSDWD